MKILGILLLCFLGSWEAQSCAPTSSISHTSKRAFEDWAMKHNIEPSKHHRYLDKRGRYTHHVYDEQERDRILELILEDEMAKHQRINEDNKDLIHRLKEEGFEVEKNWKHPEANTTPTHTTISSPFGFQVRIHTDQRGTRGQEWEPTDVDRSKS